MNCLRFTLIQRKIVEKVSKLTLVLAVFTKFKGRKTTFNKVLKVLGFKWLNNC